MVFSNNNQKCHKDLINEQTKKKISFTSSSDKLSHAILRFEFSWNSQKIWTSKINHFTIRKNSHSTYL